MTETNQRDAQLIEDAKATLVKNDLGGYTVPTHGLYPFQWNWDSAIVALGWLPFDEPRAWEEATVMNNRSDLSFANCFDVSQTFAVLDRT